MRAPSKQANIVQLDVQGEWERILVKVDSGAMDSCTSKDVGEACPMYETAASINSLKFRAASGAYVSNYGERYLKGCGGDWALIGMTLQVTDVSTTLGPVHIIIQANNRVVFDSEGSYMFNKANETRHGSFESDLWVKAPKQQAVVQKVVNAVKVQNRFNPLEEHGPIEHREGFARQDIF